MKFTRTKTKKENNKTDIKQYKYFFILMWHVSHVVYSCLYLQLLQKVNNLGQSFPNFLRKDPFRNFFKFWQNEKKL